MNKRIHHYFDGLVSADRIDEICSEVEEELQFNAAEMMVPYEESEKEAENGLCTVADTTDCRTDSMHSGRMDVDCPAR